MTGFATRKHLTKPVDTPPVVSRREAEREPAPLHPILEQCQKTMSVTMRPRDAAVGRVRFTILAMLCIITVLNYADRATLAIAGPALSKSLGLNAVAMGFAFSALGWSYVAAQLPAGWLLDRFGSKLVFFASIVAWSLATALQGIVGMVGATAALGVLIALRLLVGLAEAPSFPANGRVVMAWFPASERGTASALFNAAQYFATIVFAPVMAWIVTRFGWPWVFVSMGALGMLVALVWLLVMHVPALHPRLGKAELDYIERGGALVTMDMPKARSAGPGPAGSAVVPTVADEIDMAQSVRRLLGSRMMLGIYLGQYCINTVTYFFVTWFPVYLVQERHLTILSAGLAASVPAIFGFCGGVIGGFWSDWMVRRGVSLTLARKIPICLGLGLSMCMILCNVVETPWLVIAIMAVAFFGKGIGALGWAVNSDAAPKEIAGLGGGLFNMLGNMSLITTPIVIGFIVQNTGSFDGALIFVGANALVTVVSYLFVVGEIKRLEIDDGHTSVSRRNSGAPVRS